MTGHPIEEDRPWQRLFDTYDADASSEEFPEGYLYKLRTCSMAAFRMARDDEY